MRILRFFGSTLAIIGVTFVGVRLYSYAVGVDFSHVNISELFFIAFLAIIYAISNLMLAMAWLNLLAQTKIIVHQNWAIKTYGISQIAKYIPGNIFHLASRQAMGVSSGINGLSLAKANIWELALIAIAGALFAFLVLPLLNWNLSIIFSYLSFLFVVIIVTAFIRLWIGHHMALAFIWHTCFLAVTGLLFLSLVKLIANDIENIADITGLLIGAYVIAWLIGLLTPGAPAGIGVREIVLISLLNGVIPELELLLVVVLGRIVSACGDVIFFMATYFIPNIHSIRR